MNVAALLDAVPGASVASVDEGYGLLTVDVPVEGWGAAVQSARTDLGCAWFDFLSAVDDPDGPAVVCHLVRTDPFGHLLLRARLDSRSPVVESVASSYAGAGWHERETAEMFGITFTSTDGAPLDLEPLLLPPGFAGHPLRKDFALQARLDRPWPGAKDPGS
jgi:NADH:ubiquinone oxidoreductase subunit C